MRFLSIQLAIVACAFAPTATSAQVRRPISADSTLSVLLGKNLADVPHLIEVLRNQSGIYSRGQQDALADNLAARAIANRTGPFEQGDTASYASAARAVTVLGRSGMTDYPGMDASSPGRPYDGALDRLIRIARNTTVVAIREPALRMMLGVADRGRGLVAVRAVAEGSDTAAADDAVRVLIKDASGFTPIPHQTSAQRDQSLAVLRDLSASRRVRSRSAADQVDMWLRNRKP